MPDTRYVDTAEQLAELVGILASSPWLALDTEFIREKTYFPKLCLIQVANEEVEACIDPLAIGELDPLFPLLGSPDVVKIFHAGRQDLEILYRLTGSVPAPLFDTQIAASLLGMGEQAGYATVVRTVLGVDLPKDHTRADWERRPLAPPVIEYALDDVRYLGTLYEQMRQRLAERGRNRWVEPEFADLADPARLQPDPDSSWRKVKGSNRLRPKQLAVLQELAAWRESKAMDADKPKQWLVRDEILLECARHAPADKGALEKIRGVNEPLLQRYGETLLDAVRRGRERPPPETGRRKEQRLDPAQDAAIDLLMATVRLCGEREDISPGTLASRKDLEALLRGDEDIPLLHGWRLEAAGKTVLQALEGQLSLQIENGLASLKEKER